MGRRIGINTWKALLAKSGNRCAFPGCNCEIVDKENVIIGVAAHIEAAEKGGARYNPNQTEDERNGYENLIYLCPTHHMIVDKKEKEYTVEVLKEMKVKHEYEFQNSKCDFDYSKIYEANIELKQFLEEIDEKSKKNDCDMTIKIDKKESFSELAKTLYEYIDFIEKTSGEFVIFSEELNDKIIEQMHKLGYDTLEWEKIPYYENPFVNVFFETLAIGYDNIVKKSRLKLMQMEVLYYTEFLKFNNDNKVSRRLKKVKKELMEASGNVVYTD